MLRFTFKSKYIRNTNVIIRNLHTNAVRVPFYQCDDVDTWLAKQPIDAIKKQFDSQGFAVIHNIIDSNNLPVYQNFYDKMLNNEIDARKHRHDLGNIEERNLKNIENITQIMWPSEYIINLHSDGPFHQRTAALSKILLENGNDSVDNPTTFDFDMMIHKEAQSLTETPWHQDCAYWPQTMTDLSTCTFWCAIDNVYIENGCMWFLPQNKMQLNHQFNHKNAKEDCHVLMIDDDQFYDELKDYDGGIAVPLRAGSCTVHHGRSPHYAGGNTMDKPRRALISVYRPKAMVDHERSLGFDHGQSGLEGIVTGIEKLDQTL